MSDVRIRLQLRSSVRFASSVAVDFAQCLIARKSIAEVAGDAIVRAPNARRRALALLPGELDAEVDDARIVFSVVDAPRPRATVFVLHGIRDSSESMRGWAELLASAGYRAVLVDHRGHGRSTGDFLSYGVREVRDLSQVLDRLETLGLRVGSVGVLGFSYGAGVAVQWAGADARVRAAVALAPFASLRSVAESYLPLRFPAAFVERSLQLAGEHGGFDPDAASACDAIARTTAPVLLIHGRNDERIPYAHSERIHAARPDGCELVLVEGARHKGIVTHPETAFAERIPTWLGARLP